VQGECREAVEEPEERAMVTKSAQGADRGTGRPVRQ
jgi:hypothetical protein